MAEINEGKVIQTEFGPDRLLPAFNWLALCLNCQNTWIATCLVNTNIFKLQCPKCGEQRSFGSILTDEYEAAAKEHPGAFYDGPECD